MNRYCLIFLLVFPVTGSFAQSDKKIDLKELPEKAQVFIKKNFNKEKTQQILKETGSFLDNSYKVIFGNKVKIKFDKNGEWKEISGSRRYPVPDNLIPEKILMYIHRSFPQNQVVDIERNKKKYEVEISNGLELEFDINGNFIKIDS